MAEALASSSRITALLQIIQAVTVDFQDLKPPSKGLGRVKWAISSQLLSLRALLSELNDRAEQEEWAVTINILCVPDGPFDQFAFALRTIAGRFTTITGLAKTSKVLTWPFQQDELVPFFSTCERQKSLLYLALKNDHTYVNMILWVTLMA
jgi:hypothetical protein